MRIATYNVMLGGHNHKEATTYMRLPSLLETVAGINPDIVGFQETEIIPGEENRLVSNIRKAGEYPYDKVVEISGPSERSHHSGVAMFSKQKPSSSGYVGERAKAVEMRFPTKDQLLLSVCNVYLSHVSEDARLPEIREILQELQWQKYGIIMGDFNALSPQDGWQAKVDHFNDRMKSKYARDGRLCFDTVESILDAGYVDVGLHLRCTPESMTGMTDLREGNRKHTMPVRIDYFFATKELLPYVQDFIRVDQGIARKASDHFPWYIALDSALF